MFRVIYLFPFFIIIFYKIDTRSLLYQQLASRRPMFGKRSRKENSWILYSCSNLCFSSEDRTSSEEWRNEGGGRTIFPGRRCLLSPIYVREKRREQGRKVEGIWREREKKRRDIGRIKLGEGTLRMWRVANASSAIVAWFRVTAATLEAQRTTTATRVDFAAANRASPTECNEKTRWPALNRHAFWLEAGCFAGTSAPSDWTPPPKCVLASIFFFLYGAEIAGRIDTCRKNCCRASKVCGKILLLQICCVFHDFLFR